MRETEQNFIPSPPAQQETLPPHAEHSPKKIDFQKREDCHETFESKFYVAGTNSKRVSRNFHDEWNSREGMNTTN